MWCIHHKLGNAGGFLQCPAGPSSSPPQQGWKYADVLAKDWEGKTTASDPTLVVVPLGDHQWCPEVQVSATGVAARVVGEYTGRFIITQDFSAGLPVSS